MYLDVHYTSGYRTVIMINALKNNIESKNPALPIYRRLAEELRLLIISGGIASGSRLPSEAELSEQLGINSRTLRKSLKILADMGLISQCQGKGTFVTYHQPGRWLRFGVVLGSTWNLNDLYPMRMLTVLENAASASGSAELVLLRIKNPTTEKILAEINRTQCDGLLVLPSESEKLLLESEFDHIPMVFINMERSCSVSPKRFHVRLADGAVSSAVDYLYQLGHRKIGYIGNDHENLLRRNREFQESLSRLQLSDRHFLLSGDYDNAYDAAVEAVSRMWETQDPPTALVCPGVAFAYGAWQALMLKGVKIPQECSIIGFDINNYTNPHFSSIVQPIEDMADKAVELLFAQQGCGKQLKQKLFDFPAKIVECGSCVSLNVIH